MALQLPAPFAEKDALFDASLGPQNSATPATQPGRAKLTLPAISNTHGSAVLRIDHSDSVQIQAFLKEELDVTRLNKLDQHLAYAGLERPCRPLHHQSIVGRDIRVTEKADMHMLWEERHIYIKPLPDFLLNFQIWNEHLCRDQMLFEDANGFLLSYLWLVTRRSDLCIAHEKGLIPESISWEDWVGFVQIVAAKLDYQNLHSVNVRYRRGELRLGRVNWIYRLCSQTRHESGLFRGYHFNYYTYGSFVERNLTWMTTVVVYVALMLTAMQVGLATNALKGDDRFNAASYVFTIFSIVAPLFVVVVVLAVTIFAVLKNWKYSLRNRRNWGAHTSARFMH